jgi:GNAT superfamily N-acetyltransferase
MTPITDVSRDLAQARRLHGFLLAYFGAEELEPLSFYEAQVSAPGPVESILLLGEEDGQPVCGAVAELLVLPDGRALGAVGHALVDPSLRGRGVGRQLCAAVDEALERYAAERGWVIEAHILESEWGARRFWSQQGYRWPDRLRFWQPPLGYAPDGSPALPHVPLFLMIRHPEHVEAVPAALLREYASVLLEQWYRDELPEQLPDPVACQRARRWLDATIIAPTLASIIEDPVPLLDLQQARAEDGDWLALVAGVGNE